MAEAGAAFSLLRIPIAAARRDEFIDTFTALRIFELANAENGLLSAVLLKPTSDDSELLVLAEWPTAAAYQGWLDNPVRAQVNERLTPFVDAEMSGGTFVAAHAFEAALGDRR